MTEDEKIEKLKELYKVGVEITYKAQKHKPQLLEKLTTQYNAWKEEVKPLLYSTSCFQIDTYSPWQELNHHAIKIGDVDDMENVCHLSGKCERLLDIIWKDLTFKLKKKDGIN